MFGQQVDARMEVTSMVRADNDSRLGNQQVDQTKRVSDCWLLSGTIFCCSECPRGKIVLRKLLRARQVIVEGVIGEAKGFHLLNR